MNPPPTAALKVKKEKAWKDKPVFPPRSAVSPAAAGVEAGEAGEVPRASGEAGEVLDAGGEAEEVLGAGGEAGEVPRASG